MNRSIKLPVVSIFILALSIGFLAPPGMPQQQEKDTFQKVNYIIDFTDYQVRID